jgi:ferredoxin
MSLKITGACINCSVCEYVCPNQSITQGEFIYEISRNRCTECVGHYDQPQCQEVCPADCIILDSEHPETHDQLFSKYKELTAEIISPNEEG